MLLLTSFKHVIKGQFPPCSLSTLAEGHLCTLDDGVVGHCLHVAAIVVERQVPHPRVQVLDEPGLMDEDGMIQLAGSPVLFGDQPAAIQQLHKIILQMHKDSSRRR